MRVFKPSRLPAVFALLLTVTACESTTEPEVNDVPNVPATLEGRPVEVLQTIDVHSRDLTLATWDSGDVVDGDIISLFVNGSRVINELELLGPGSKFVFPITLEFEGYNNIVLFAHNIGDIPPNTAALTIDDGTSVQEVILNANLDTNGAISIRVVN